MGKRCWVKTLVTERGGGGRRRLRFGGAEEGLERGGRLGEGAGPRKGGSGVRFVCV